MKDRVALRAADATLREPPGFVMARHDEDGRLASWQIVRYGVGAGEPAALRRRLLTGPVPVPVPAHGRPAGVLRDAVLASVTTA